MTLEKPPERLGFLLARQGQIMNARIRQALGESGLSSRHGSTLMRLQRTGATSQQSLVDALSIDASALVAILNDLERDGFIERRRDVTDRRRHIVEITASGVSAASVVEDAIGIVERDAFAELDEGEVALLHSLLTRVRARHEDEEPCTSVIETPTPPPEGIAL